MCARACPPVSCRRVDAVVANTTSVSPSRCRGCRRALISRLPNIRACACARTRAFVFVHNRASIDFYFRTSGALGGTENMNQADGAVIYSSNSSVNNVYVARDVNRKQECHVTLPAAVVAATAALRRRR
jgi:hypothetical protein